MPDKFILKDIQLNPHKYMCPIVAVVKAVIFETKRPLSARQ